MNCGTILGFLVGRRNAISEIVNCQGSLWVGGLFVLSAGFAREYNQEDLLHAPWYLIVPLIASLATSFVLFCLLYMAARCHAPGPIEFLPFYRRFLSLYWMTAPLAWIYAIPVESFLNSADSVRANLGFLALVSLWRVLLISRCASVLFGFPYVAAFFLVMLFADTLALGILSLTPLPVFNIMGGIPLTESEAVIRDTACNVQFFGGVSWLIWFIGTCIIFGMTKRHWMPLTVDENSSAPISKPLWAVCILALLVWIGILPYSQPPQRLRREVEADLLNNRIELALGTMSNHERSAFPTHWDPPPWQGYGQDTPPLLEVMQAIDEQVTADWVKDVYFEKLSRRIASSAPSITYFWVSLTDEEFNSYMTIIEDNSRLHDTVRSHADIFRNLIYYDSEPNSARRKRLRSLLTNLGIDLQKDEDEHEPEDDVEPAGDSVDRR